MKTLQTIGAFIAVIAVYWLFTSLKSNEVSVSGPLMVKPKPGYVWSGSLSANSKFWGGSVTWVPGIQHPEFPHALAADTKENWVPEAGYLFAKSGSFETVWNPGMRHPAEHAYASETEGNWLADPGYDFIKNDQGQTVTSWTPGLTHPNHWIFSTETINNWRPYPGYSWNTSDQNDLDVHWVPGTVIPDLHIEADNMEGRFLPSPGYKFTDPGKSLAVAWTPGLPHRTYPDAYVAGSAEGEWVTASNNDPSSDFMNTIGFSF